MNLLDTASLVVTPNGYKASKLYSIIPSDGSGDMTFARTGDTATRVNSSGLIESVLANKPRLDYLGSTCPKLLLEPQRTNLATYSEQFDQGPWSTLGTATVTANAIASPSGSVNADKLVENTGTNSHLIYGLNISSTANTSYTVSLYLKAGERYQGFISISNITNSDDNFNLNTGICTYGTLTNVGNGWFRYVRTYSSSTTISSFIALYLRNNAGSSNYTGDGTSGMYLWGAQWEAGAYATSYIPTTTASVTRNADNCNKTSINSLIGGTSGTIFFNIKTNPTLTTATYKQFVYYLSATSQQEYFYVNQNNRIVTSSNWGSLVSSNTLVADTTYKIALGFSPSSHVLYVNGVQVASSTTGTPYDADKIDSLFSFQGGASEYGEFKLNSFAHWKTKLQNSELATLTSL